ncbi:MAG TPA: nucleotide-binding protein [Vicingaceae bacterium]
MAKQNILKLIENLKKQGNEFTFRSYTDRKDSEQWGGNPNANWIAWVTRIKNLLDKAVSKNSAPHVYFSTASKIPLKGYAIDNFLDAKNNYLKSLSLFEDLLIEGDYFDELIDKSIIKKTDRVQQESESTTKSSQFNKVFIVHGHDHNLKAELEVFLLKLNLQPIVLHREVDQGQTIIEKFESNSDVAYVFILLTPDEVAYTVDQHEKDDNVRDKEYRARPNVIFEFGYFTGKLGRKKVCALHKGNVTLPSDLSGVVYKKVNDSIEDIGFALIKELKSAGLKITI